MSLFNSRRVGYTLVLLSMLAAGLSTGVRFYYLVSLLLVCMLALGAISAAWTLFSLRLELQGVKRRVTRGDSMMTVLTVRHTSLLPVSTIAVELSVPSAYAPSQLVNVYAPPFVSRRFRQVVACPHRGIYEAGITRVRVTDIFGMMTFSRRPKGKLVRMEVLPRLLEAEALPLASIDTGFTLTRRAMEDNASPSDVRNWQDGDELKKVHWKLSLRRRELTVRTYEETVRPDMLIIPDLTGAASLRDRQLAMEDAVCEAALAAAKAQLDADCPVRMPLMGAQPMEVAAQTSHELPQIQDALLHARFDSPYAFEQVLALMLGRMQRTGGAVLITPRLTTTIADTALRMRASGISTKLIWIADDAPEEQLRLLERLKMSGVRTEQMDPYA